MADVLRETTQQHESKAIKALKQSIEELEEKCRECKTKKCTINCETKRRIDCCNDLLNGRGRHSRRI